MAWEIYLRNYVIVENDHRLLESAFKICIGVFNQLSVEKSCFLEVNCALYLEIFFVQGKLIYFDDLLFILNFQLLQSHCGEW